MHVAEKYEVKYSTGTGFHNANDLFEDLCHKLGVEYWNDGDNYEVSEDEWDNLLGILKDRKNTARLRNEWGIGTKVISQLENSYSEKELDDAVTALDYFDKCADKSDGYVHLSYF